MPPDLSANYSQARTSLDAATANIEQAWAQVDMRKELDFQPVVPSTLVSARLI
jgi:hypothetical protein